MPTASIIPSYNANPIWSINANRARHTKDYAAAWLAAITIYPTQFSENPSAIWIASIVALVSLVFPRWIPKLSFIPADDNPQGA